MSTHVSKSLLACLCAAAALVSCSKEQATEEPVSGVKLVPMTFHADLSQISKAYLDSSDQLCWAEGDELLIWDGTQSCVFTLEAGYAGSTSGKFTGYVTEGAQEFSAIYPATDASGNEWTWNASASAFNWGVPALQTPGAQSSDRFALIATASAHRGGQLLFTNAPALLRFTVAAGVSEVIFHSRSKELLAAGSTSVTVSIPDAEGGTYEAAINPGTYDGIRAFVVSGGSAYLKEGSTALTLEAGHGKKLGTINPSTEVSLIRTGLELNAYLTEPVLDAYVINDLDLSSITLPTELTYNLNFCGQHHSVSNWTTSAPMFGILKGSVSDLIVESSCTVEAVPAGDFGVFATKLDSGSARMSRCVNKANLTISIAPTEQFVTGGVVGRLASSGSSISNCENYGNITITHDLSSATAAAKTQYIAGIMGVLAGQNNGVDALRVDSCKNYGNVTYTGIPPVSGTYLRNVCLGGIAAGTGVNSPSGSETSGYTKSYGRLTGCENEGNISATWGGGTGGYFNVGGIMGYAEATFDGCINRGSVSYTNSLTTSNARPSIGGICGTIAGTTASAANAFDCCNYGSVSLTGNFANAGSATGGTCAGSVWSMTGGCFGCVGDNTTLVSNCDNEGPVNVETRMAVTAGSSAAFGGIVGWSNTPLSGCDNSGNLTVWTEHRNVYIGGVAGEVRASLTECTSSGEMDLTPDCSSINVGTVGETTYDDPKLFIGGITGRFNVATDGISISSCTTGEESTVKTLKVAVKGYKMNLGGIAGLAGDPISGSINNYKIDVDRTYVNTTVSKTNYIGGIVGTHGSSGNPRDLSQCTNNGAMEVNLDSGSPYSYVSGVVAYTYGTSVSYCSNTGSITFDGGGMVKQMCITGIASWSYTAACTFDHCVNEGDIEVGNWTNTSFNYIGGIYGNYTTGNNVYKDCTNSGNLTSTATSKMRMGGIGAAINAGSAVTRCSSTGNVTATNCAADSQIGGIAGYVGKGSFTSCNYSADVTVTTSNSSYVGAFFGCSNATQTLKTCGIGGTVTTNGASITGGTIMGSYTGAKTLTLNGNTITSTLNGVAASSDNYIGYNTGTIN